MEGTNVMMSLYEAKTAKRVYLYRNGAINSQPKCLVVNERQVRDFSTFLNRVTSGLKAPVAIRNIYTPSGGHKVKNLSDLRSGHYYVAGGAEHFKKVKYGDSPQRLLSRRPPRTELVVPPRTHQAVVASARYKKPVEKPFIIHVFRNGDERYRGARVLLSRRIMGSWDHVLEIVADKVNLFTPVKRLCTLDGRTLHAVSELQDGGKYVAIEGTKPFQRVSYCATEERKFLRHTTLPRVTVRLRRRSERRHTDTEQQDESLSDSDKTPFLTMSLQHRVLKRRQSRPMAGRKNKAAREKAIEDHRADSIFGGSPTNHLSSPSPPPQPIPSRLPQQHQQKPPQQQQRQQQQQPHPLIQNQTPKSTVHTTPLETTHATRSRVSPDIEKKDASEVAEEELMSSKGSSVSKKTGLFHAQPNTQSQKQLSQEYTEDSQGETVFKAKTEHSEVQDAEVVVESGDTEVEKPVDLEEAEEVEEEKEEKEDTHQEQTTHDDELKTQPLQTSVDLSLNRNTLPTVTTPPPSSLPSAPLKDPTPATSSAASIHEQSQHPSKTNSGVNIDSVSVVEKLEQSRTHSVLSKKEEPLKDKDDVQEEIKDQGADVPEEVKGSEGKSDTASVQQQQEVVAEEIEGEQEVETAVPAQSLDEQEKPTEGTKQHTESPVSQPEEEIEEVEEVKAEVKEEDAEADTEEVVEEVEQDTGSEEHKDSTTSQPENISEPDTATFVIEDPTS